MKYILIALLSGSPNASSPMTSIGMEFDDLPACVAAVGKLTETARAQNIKVNFALCVPKATTKA
jgi:hypothetical protein